MAELMEGCSLAGERRVPNTRDLLDLFPIDRQGSRNRLCYDDAQNQAGDAGSGQRDANETHGEYPRLVRCTRLPDQRGTRGLGSALPVHIPLTSRARRVFPSKDARRKMALLVRRTATSGACGCGWQGKTGCPVRGGHGQPVPMRPRNASSRTDMVDQDCVKKWGRLREAKRPHLEWRS